MLILLLLIAAFNVSSSAPVLPPPDALDPPIPLTIFGRELPECMNVARYRTMQDIVWSCLATIFACTWVAVHPNVPDPCNSGWKTFKERVTIMIYAIIGPEFVTTWALKQRLGAAEHVRNYNRRFHKGVNPPAWSLFNWFRNRGEEKPGGPWTLTHAFLLEMRGLMKYQDGKPAGYIEKVSELEERFDMSEEEINDKNKGDFLTKLLVVLQTTWFIFQCLARWIKHLPVTELEVVTLGFAFLNIITYALWWNKPQNMRVAIPVHVHTPPKGSPCETCGSIVEEKVETAESDGMQGRPENGGDLSHTSNSIHSDNDPETSGIEGGCRDEESAALLSEPPQHYAWARRFFDNIPKSMNWLMRWMAKAFSSLLTGLYQLLFPMCNWRDMDTMDWFAFLIVRPVEPLLAMFIGPVESSVVENSPLFYASKEVSTRAIFTFSLIAAVFGCIHLIPIWTSSFPSYPEKMLWQVSAFWITTQPPLAPCIVAIIDTFDNTVANLLLSALFFVGYLGYAIARLILIVLAFTTLRNLPVDAYKNIAWTTFLPHF